MEVSFESGSFAKRLKSMLSVDLRRILVSPLFYIMVGVCFVMPILILVMTTMMDGTVSINPETGVETVIEGFENTWQVIAAKSDASSAMDMSLTGMCNINMLYFIIAAFVCIFVSDDFRSGYAKNLFTVRAKKTDYVISKTVIGFAAGACMIIAYFIGAMLGGAISSLPFDLGNIGAYEVIMCLLSKIFLVAVFVPICVLAGSFAKQKLWLSIVGTLGISMLFFTTIPMMSPLDSGIVNAVLCLAGGVLFSVGLGALSDLVLRKTNIL